MENEKANILLVAFDGLDRNLIEKYGLVIIQQEETGTLDVKTEIKEIVTDEIFLSLITGSNYESHGVQGGVRKDASAVLRASKYLNKYWVFRKWAGTRHKILKRLGLWGEPPLTENLDVNTLFDTISNSKALFVPVVTKERLKFSPWDVLDNRYLDDHDFREVVEKEHLWRKTKFFEALEQEEPFDFLMVHFHKPDYLQHVFGDPEINYDEDVLRELYQEVDELAAVILEKAGNQYDYIIFMSDHGLPEAAQHNENAFYSVNRTVGWENPTVFDLHDFILETIGTGQGSLDENGAKKAVDTRDRNQEIKNKLEELGYI